MFSPAFRFPKLTVSLNIPNLFLDTEHPLTSSANDPYPYLIDCIESRSIMNNKITDEDDNATEN